MLLAAKEMVELPWLEEHKQHFNEAITSERCPHACLRYG